MATNYLIGEDGKPLPDGIVLQHTLWGEPDQKVTHAYTATGAGGVQLIPATDGVEYVPSVEHRPPERDKRCAAKENTCMGWRIADSEFCSAHSGKFDERWDRLRGVGASDVSAEQ